MEDIPTIGTVTALAGQPYIPTIGTVTALAGQPWR
jgi:hypothetical protein